MKIATVSLFAAGIASTGVIAAPAPMEVPGTSPNLAKRGLWLRDECFPESGGNTIGGSTLWMLRNTWNNRFGGDFSGSLGVYQYKGVCCWGQCLFVSSEGQGRRWSGDAWGNALSRLQGVVGNSKRGLCGARIDNDAYLVLMTVQHDAVTLGGPTVGQVFGDTCGGNPPW
ncbi:hypothetical protein COCC4DRAFT_153778 [Bipolaris maydis ATCC 48331]|uniref:Ecp2 effector protein domain-containing protein n=2 Tax=Cochliobolus heterostrophus TaxID=5016 RepID=M2TTJ4_COCH5|nr:uncharacterized protein COCC4DRAFT_153778 [Bipolaris maydis ATCC 48331]EMD85091.1 hypothetical protein COCHEDRAFT_1120003 [Bipolaris maydis C5]KAH7559955.1 hypothetical protein BM1_03589 [Bipolaris maydis]ENH99245.1 hypothetical protein COCC4DRAFT_153778 [Bipolaris maydis ATCC 48331]KAJ5022514.1 hypothetical protein J3E73DRAFT_260688 [Bipolaris maydis]KAJ5064771.1 hypothetical protein J3E74DRAFT_287380 [Bipolaris maydis]